MVSKSNKFLQALVTGLLTIVGSFYLLGTTSATLQAPTKLTGDLWVSGQVTLNGASAKTGITVFDGGRIKTSPSASATINLNRLGRIRLESETEIVLRFSDKIIGGEVISGKAMVNASKGIGVSIATPSGIVEAENKQLAALQVTVTADDTCVASTGGGAKITSGNKIERINAGEEVTVSKAGRGTTRRWLAAAAGAGAGAAISFGTLASESVAASIASVSNSSAAPPGNNSEAGAVAQSATSPSATPTPRPVTPVKPPPTVEVCGCKYNANTGQAIDPGQKVTISHVPANDPSKCNTIIISCSALPGHFNLNGTPRAGHLCDICGPCSGYVRPATCPMP